MQESCKFADDFINYAREFQEWFRNEDAVKADLTKKPHNREIESDVASHGKRGSFRKLRIDWAITFCREMRCDMHILVMDQK